jgi:hypothetical protein
MVTRVRLELDSETYGKLMRVAVAEKRPADWQAEVILRRALGTWEEGCVGSGTSIAASEPRLPVKQEAERAPA